MIKMTHGKHWQRDIGGDGPGKHFLVYVTPFARNMQTFNKKGQDFPLNGGRFFR
jgi:hypothetical protein